MADNVKLNSTIMSITIKNIGGFRMEISNEKEQTHTDAPASHGGKGELITPVELFAESLMACALTTASMGAAKAGINADGWHAELKGIEFAEGHASVTAIAIEFHFGSEVPEAQRRRIEAFTKNGCTVGNSLKTEEKFTFVYDA